ncbi:DNA polymerase III subunit gamma/tau [Candidatus Daviesbacteria bacterium]|nr:DNA polymerase III subunit gamma/tau [Candidatus Daviesbacteria bacterium]
MKNANIAYYLKYRPQTLTDLIGQDLVKKTLLSAYSTNKLSHAYLFVGPRGTGKTSTARILAKMVNCEGKNIPCNECTTCLSITDGSNLDLIEIDAASNRGIEDIRSLRDKIKLAPTNSRKKVYIIDEVHMLTQEAFNALLKTLEEPPNHALFILATTDAQKIPQTVLSRVQRLDFKPAKSNELLEVFQKIVKMEKINIDEEALKLLIKKADGSFRDGVKLLDQVSSMEGKITGDILEKFLKAANFEKLLEFVGDLAKLDTTKALSLVVKEVNEGVDVKELVLSLMDLLRNIVFIKNGLGEQLVKEDYSEENFQSLIKVSENFTNQDLVKILDSLQKALEQMKTTSIPSLPLELAVVEICGEQISKTIDDGKLKIEVEDGTLKMEKQEEIHPQPSILKEPSSTIHHPPSNDDIQKLKEKWTFVLETIRPVNFSLEALLRSVSITHCTDTTLIMEVPYSFHQRILESPKNREILEGILSEILGRQIRISVSLGARPQRIEDLANIEVAADDEIIRAAAEIFNSDAVN